VSPPLFDQGRWNASNLLRAPFGYVADTILALMLR
jgi:coniferyl-aldehyde dehydrogenase